MHLVAILALSVAGVEQQIDGFSYRDSAAARQAWTTISDTHPPEVVADSGRNVLKLLAPFGTQPSLPRTILDRQVELDLAGPGAFVLEVQADPPEAIARLALAFHSRSGWYTASAPLAKPGWQAVRFLKSSFRSEGRPQDWNRIDKVRLSAWGGQRVDVVLRFRRLKAVGLDATVIVPASSDQASGEIMFAHDTARRVTWMLEDLGLVCDRIDERTLAGGGFGTCNLAVLPFNPQLGDEALAALEGFAARGGRLLVCFSLPPRLAKLLELKSPQRIVQDRPGRFWEMRFDDAAITGLPDVVRQSSENILRVETAGAGTRIAGRWYDDRGQSTGFPALVVCRKGAYLSDVLHAGESESKRQLLAALIGHFEESLWPTMARAELERAGRIGPFATLDAFEESLGADGNPQARSSFAAGRRRLIDAQREFEAGRYAAAMVGAKQGRAELVRAFARVQASRPREGRAVWNYSGTGAYPGDWERSARELAKAGFNLVLPNMFAGGAAHYESRLLPPSPIVRQYGDQLAQCLAAAKRHGLEVHVKKIVFNLVGVSKQFVDSLRAEKRLVVSSGGQPRNWLCPSHPKNFALALESLLEVTRRYDVDGLHLDYIRYSGADCCYCDGCRQRFESESGKPVAAWPADCLSGQRREEYQEFRCRQITRLVEAVHREAKRVRPAVKISAAVFQSYPDCRRTVGQDWVAWAKAGYVDFLCPMDYTPVRAKFRGLVEDQLRLVDGRIPLYPGIGVTSAQSELTPDNVLMQIDEARRLGAGGFTLFDFRHGMAESLLPTLALGAGSQPAVPPHRQTTERSTK